MLLKRIYSPCLLLRSIPDFSVYSRCSFALVFCHSFHGKGFAAEGVGQQMLQGFHFTPSAFLCCLYDTRLEPTHILFDFLPINGCQSIEVWETAPAVTSAIICFVSFVSLFKFSRKERPDGSLPVFTRDDVTIRFNPYPLHYRAAFAFSIFFCPQPRWLPLQVAFPDGRATGLPCSAYMQ